MIGRFVLAVKLFRVTMLFARVVVLHLVLSDELLIVNLVDGLVILILDLTDKLQLVLNFDVAAE